MVVSRIEPGRLAQKLVPDTQKPDLEVVSTAKPKKVKEKIIKMTVPRIEPGWTAS